MRASFPGSRGRVRLVAAALLATVVCVALAACSVAATFPACCGTESCGTSGTSRNGLICCCSTGSIGLTWNYPSSSPTCATQPPPCASAPTPPSPDPTPTPDPYGPLCEHHATNVFMPPGRNYICPVPAGPNPDGGYPMAPLRPYQVRTLQVRARSGTFTLTAGFVAGYNLYDWACPLYVRPDPWMGQSSIPVTGCSSGFTFFNISRPQTITQTMGTNNAESLWTFHVQCWPTGSACTVDVDIVVVDPTLVPPAASSSTAGPGAASAGSSTGATGPGQAEGGGDTDGAVVDSKAESNALSTGTIIGLAVGSALFVVAVIGLGACFYTWTQRRALEAVRKQLEQRQSSTTPSDSDVQQQDVQLQVQSS